MENCGIPLSKWNLSINRGILTGLNEAFIINQATKEKLIEEDPKSEEIIRPILRGRDIKRYQYSYADLWIIATFPSRNYDIDDYPSVKKHLLSFGIERLRQDGKSYQVNGETIRARKKTNNKWFETQDSIKYWDDFYKQKIVWGNLCLSSQFAIAEEGIFINAPSPIIVPGNKYLLAVLNSSLGDWYIRQLGVTRNGGYFEYKPMFVEKLPVPCVSECIQEQFSTIVDKIISKKKQHEDTSKEESIIDNMVFDLYGLTVKERMYIENGSFLH